MRYISKDDENIRGKRMLLVVQPQKPPITTVRTPISVLDLAEYYRKFADAKVDCATLEHLPKGSYDYVGYSVLCENNDIEKEIRLLAKTFPTARVIVGGKWATDPGRNVEVDDNVIFYRGPGELLATPTVDYEGYPGWNSGDLAMPGLDIQHLGVMTSRGCPYRCHFCHNTETAVNHFNPQRTVHNVKTAFERLGISYLFFNDDIFTSSPKRMHELLDLFLKSGIDIRGHSKFFTHVNFVKPDALEAIKAYRPWRVEIGIESGSTEQLKRLGKTFTAEKAYTTVKTLLDQNIPLSALFLIGFPGETVATLEETLKFVNHFRKHLKYIGVSYYQPVKNTVGWKMCVERLGREPKVGERCHLVSYIDPNLSKEILVSYFHKIKGE